MSRAASQPDLAALRSALAVIESEARDLPWNGRPGDTWTIQDYIKMESGLPTIDLHDLDVELAVRATTLALSVPLQAPIVRVITGRGSHSPGGKPRIRERVLELWADRVAKAEVGHVDLRVGLPVRSFWSVFWNVLGWLFRWLFKKK